MQPVPAAVFRVNEKDRAWVDAMCTPQPSPRSPTRSRDRRARAHRQEDLHPRQELSQRAVRRRYADLKTDSAWRVYELPCGHDVMVDMPERLAEILLEVA